MISGGGPDSTGTVACSCNHLTNFAVQVVSVCTVMWHSFHIMLHKIYTFYNTLIFRVLNH